MKVAIVGAGICGLYIAWKLAKKGEEVTVFEKREKIGKEACSGLFSERILDFIPESQKLIENEINYCLIHFPERTLKIKFSKKFLVMNHFELDNLVANLAQKAGVKIILKYALATFDVVRLEGEFDRVIGCDGANSIVRKSLGLPEPNFRLAIQGFIQEAHHFNYVETWPVKNGFLWKIPRGKAMEYGIIGDLKGAKRRAQTKVWEGGGRVGVLLEEFLKENNLQLENLENLKSTLIPQGLTIPSHPTITLCGDASGLTKPWSGGGVIWGLTAANLLLQNFPDFLKYKKQVQRFFSAKILFSKMATRLVYFLGFKTPWLLPKEFKIEGDFLI